jgi:hypothetical protein
LFGFAKIEKNAEKISELFFNADIGVSRADYNYFGKRLNLVPRYFECSILILICFC